MKRLVAILLCLGLLCITPASLAEPEILVPDAYTQTGTLPVYKATARNFGETLQPELFNGSGIASRGDWTLTYNDEATLEWAPEALFYREYSGTFNANAGTEYPAAITARPALSSSIASLASWAMFGWPDGGMVFTLEKTTLTHLTLTQAQTVFETLLSQLGLQGYACDYALDMSLERIHTLGDSMNAMIQSGAFSTNIPPCDYQLATAEDEGFYLSYHLYGHADGAGDQFSAYALVTARGVVDASIRDAYIPGEVYETPEALVSPETVLAALPKEIAASRYPEKLVRVLRVELTYAAMRASKKADGMVLSPIWSVTYQDEMAGEEGYTSWADFDAVDGKLLNAIFK